VVEFRPKDVKKAQRKIINNIYIKNIPEWYTDAQIREMFETFGNIKSCVVNKHDFGKFAFVCYEDPVNKEYGPECAQKAIDATNGREIEGSELKLIVKSALTKAQREIEKQRETIRYKQSKKRCNLYVKNFPNSWNEQILNDIFK
jgi:polyadenylate-binding protein